MATCTTRKTPKHSPQFAREALSYCPETGELTWKTRPESHFKNAHGMRIFNSRYASTIAGTIHSSGHSKIRLDRTSYYTHNLAWVIIHGEWPTEFVDHINGDPSDNRACNLRLATMRENNRNVRPRSNNTSGKSGVHWSARKQKWVANIWLGKRLKHLGQHDSKEAAVEARIIAEREYWGEFAPSARPTQKDRPTDY